MMSEDDLNRAIALDKSGRKIEAREILEQIVQDDPKNDRAWMWLADTYLDNPDRIAVLEEWRENNPDNQKAQKGLATLRAEEAKKRKTKKCPDCGVMNQGEAIICAFCGSDLKAQTPVISQPVEAPKEKMINETISTENAPQSKEKRGAVKKCPYCAEEIQDEAIVCKYCGRDLRPAIPPSPPIPPPPPTPKRKKSRVWLYIVIPAIVVCSGLFLYVLRPILVAAYTPSAQAIQTAIAQTQVVWTPISTQTPYPTQTPFPTQTPYPTQTRAIVTQVYVWTPTIDPSKNSCKPISGMNYFDRSKIMVNLQAYVAGLPNVKSVSYVIPEKLYSNSQSELFHVRYVDSSDGKVYSKRYIVYLREFGWKPAVFSIDGQCWIDPP